MGAIRDNLRSQGLCNFPERLEEAARPPEGGDGGGGIEDGAVEGEAALPGEEGPPEAALVVAPATIEDAAHVTADAAVAALSEDDDCHSYDTDLAVRVPVVAAVMRPPAAGCCMSVRTP